MANKCYQLSILLLLMVCRLVVVQEIPKLVNLDGQCLRCLCHAASGCNLTVGCDKGYCGPYKISRIYWKDSGEVTLPDDDRERDGAYEDCAISFQCSQRIIMGYFLKYAKDCNGDGITDCEDYAMINFNGGFQCQAPLDRNESGRKWLQRFRACRPLPI